VSALIVNVAVLVVFVGIVTAGLIWLMRR